FNRYSYVLNDPMNLVDPTGFVCTIPGQGGVCKAQEETFGDDVVVGTRSAAPSHIDTEVPQRPIDVDTAVHWTATQVGNLMDRHSPHLNPDLPFVVNRASSNPTGVVLEFAAAHMFRGAVEDLGTFADRDASAGDRAIAGVSTLLAVVPAGRGVGLARRGIQALTTSRFVARASRAVNLPGWRKLTVDMVHIAERHMDGGRLIAGRDVFTGMSERGVMAAIRQAYGNATIVSVQNERLLLRGISKTGVVVEMWLNRATRTIETAYQVMVIR
ncbi:MAG: hypothetical protein KF768_14690, partial [Phycisphaeraceae bacterium]|nr:hypothetical protein [Phycisphaeraceae bacterium]